MSNQSNSYSNLLSEAIVKKIDLLNLPLIQKQHVRLLAHCLEVFKGISKDEESLFNESEILREWCDKQSQKFNDEHFNNLLYQQMSSAAKKLNSFSRRIKKDFKQLDLDDLIILVEQDQAN